MEGQHFQYSVVEFDEESLILYDPESSLEGDEMGAFTEECLQGIQSLRETFNKNATQLQFLIKFKTILQNMKKFTTSLM